MDILIKNMTAPKYCFEDDGSMIAVCPFLDICRRKWGVNINASNIHSKCCPLIPVPEHNDLADKSVIIERMGEVYEALYDKVDKKALSECHVAFLKAVMYAPTVIPSTVKIPTEEIEPKGVWDETLTTDAEGERTT